MKLRFCIPTQQITISGILNYLLLKVILIVTIIAPLLYLNPILDQGAPLLAVHDGPRHFGGLSTAADYADCLCVFCVGPLCGPPLRWWVLCGVLPSVWVPCGWGSSPVVFLFPVASVPRLASRS